jgi:hypothetical protein
MTKQGMFLETQATNKSLLERLREHVETHFSGEPEWPDAQVYNMASAVLNCAAGNHMALFVEPLHSQYEVTSADAIVSDYQLEDFVTEVS